MVREVGHRTALVMPGTHKRQSRQNRNAWSRDRVCEDCGRLGIVRRDNSSTICRSCSSHRRHPPGSSPGAPRNRIEVACRGCGSPFERIPSDLTHQFCSRECRTKAARVERVCKECDVLFVVGRGVISGKTNSRGNFCSLPCYHKWMCRTDRTTGRGSQWFRIRAESIRRNPFCALCGNRRRLQVHHIIPFRLTHDNDQDNLIPLCGKDHKIVETTFLEIERCVCGDLESAKFILGSLLRSRQDITRITLMEIRERVGYSNSPSSGRAVVGDPPRRICPQSP